MLAPAAAAPSRRPSFVAGSVYVFETVPRLMAKAKTGQSSETVRKFVRVLCVGERAVIDELSPENNILSNLENRASALNARISKIRLRVIACCVSC